MNADNDRRKSYANYFIIAIACAFVFAFFLNIATSLVIAAAKVLIKFWWVGLVAVFGFLILRKLLGKKK